MTPRSSPPGPDDLLADLACEVQELFRFPRRTGFRAEMGPLADHDFWLFDRGRAEITVNGEPIRLEAGPREVLLMFRPGDRITTQILSPARLYYCHFQPTNRFIWERLICPRHLILPPGCLGPLLLEAWEQQRACLKAGRSPRLVREVLIKRLWEALARHGALIRRPATRDPRLATLEKLVQRLERDLESPLNLPQASAAVGIGSKMANRLFRTHLNTTPMKFRTEHRLRLTQQLLLAGKTLSEVAEQCGYPDPFTCSKAFKRRHGLAPAAWLRSRRDAVGG